MNTSYAPFESVGLESQTNFHILGRHRCTFEPSRLKTFNCREFSKTYLEIHRFLLKELYFSEMFNVIAVKVNHFNDQKFVQKNQYFRKKTQRQRNPVLSQLRKMHIQ